MNKTKRINKLSKLLLTTALVASLCCTAAFSAGVVDNNGAGEPNVEVVSVVHSNDVAAGNRDANATDDASVDNEVAGNEAAVDEAVMDTQTDSARTKYIVTGVVILAVGIAFYVVLHIKTKKNV